MSERRRPGDAGRTSEGDRRLRIGVVLGVAGLAAALVSILNVRPAPEVGAQVPFVPAELVSYEPSGLPLSAAQPTQRNLSLSGLGHVAGYEHQPAAHNTLVRVRPDAATVVPAPQPAINHGMSDDGCVVAYTGPAPPATTAVFPPNLFAFNRCAGGTQTLLGPSGPVGTSGPRPPPALNANGTRIAFSVPGGIAYFGLGSMSRAGTTSLS